MSSDAWLIGSQQVQDWKSLVRKLCDRGNPLSNYLCARFSRHTQELLAAHDPSSPPLLELQNAITDDLNLLLQGESIYDPERFTGITLTQTSREWIERGPSGEERAHLNRLLLAEAYGWEITTGLKTGSLEWHKFQIEKYETERPYYEAYAAALQQILEAAKKLYAPLGIVEARPKTLSSFAAKALDRVYKYDRPAHQITDLCGARVIVDTQEEVKAICRFVREHFRIDEANSPDIRARLKTAEFGYLSEHLVVQVKEPEVLGIPLPPEIGDRKAEIQVRTLLQHAWSNIGHDRVYKSSFKVPEQLKRDLHRVAAVLEEADQAFGEAVAKLDAFLQNYGAYLESDKRVHEIKALRTILANEKDDTRKPRLALQIARLLKASWNWPEMVAELEPFIRTAGREQPELLMEHGHALCRDNRDLRNPEENARYETGLRELKQAAAQGKGKTQVQARAYLGWAYGNQREQEGLAREQFRKALEAAPSNPYVLASFLEYESYCRRNRELAREMFPLLQQAIDTCRKHADAEIELPWAFFAIGRFYLLLGRHYDSLAAYAKAIHLCSSGKASAQEEMLEEERRFLRRINVGAVSWPVEDVWIDTLLKLGEWICFHREGLPPEAQASRIRTVRFEEPVVIVAGGTDPGVEVEMQQYGDCLLAAFEGFQQGTIISGGTTAGIPGLVGGLAQHFSSTGSRVRVIGYLPKYIPTEAPEDTRYHEHIRLPNGTDFTPQEPLQSWIDLIAAGVKPQNVKVLGINGGKIAAFEYRLALALGATVGVIESSGRAVADLLPDADWWNASKLFWLPADPSSAKAFVCPGEITLKEEQLVCLGQEIHKKFLAENRWKVELSSPMMPWESLRPDYRESNLQQAACMEEILRRSGFGIQPYSGAPLPEEYESRVNEMAEAEHGRWNVERLQKGWKYGPVKDTEKKISPFLVAWKDLPDEVRDWDREAVRAWPDILKEAGLEIYKLPENE